LQDIAQDGAPPQISFAKVFPVALAIFPTSKPRLFSFVLVLSASQIALAGGPKFVAGVNYFNPAVVGQAVHWSNGQVNYFVDQGPLNSEIDNQTAKAMVDAAAAIWTAVPTAAVNLIDAGNLAEDVSGANVVPGTLFVSEGMSSIAQPMDVTSSATNTAVGVIFDADGSVIDALGGAGASEPDNCSQNGVFVWIDNFNPDATLTHGIILLNGLCATSPNLVLMMSYQLERAFGRILGLDFSQVNIGAQTPGNTEPNGTLGWPVMQPLSGDCGPLGGSCIPSPGTLRWDDIAALNRIYPVTAANQPSFLGKLITSVNTVSIQGTVAFRNGTGMQGVNVVARPLDSNGDPLYQYTTTFVSGGYFAGNHGNPVTGWTDLNGNPLDEFGSDDQKLQGYFDLSGIPLPPGTVSANYQVTFEAISPLFIDASSVGPYVMGAPAPSGTMPTLLVSGMSAGSTRTLNIKIANSAAELDDPDIPTAGIVSQVTSGTAKNLRAAVIDIEGAPQTLPSSGIWTSRLGLVGQTDWFTLPVRGNRIFTVVTQALNESGVPTGSKAMPALGVWDGYDQVGTAAVGFAGAENGFAPGETWLQVATSGNDIVRLAVSDQRGDGRPDYTYRGWILYADSVTPVRLPVSGGNIDIRGMGFRSGDTVKVGGVAATVTSIFPNEISAVVPPAAKGASGSLDVEVDDLPLFTASAVIPGGISFDAATSDALSVVTEPANQVPLNVPQPFSVLAKSPNGSRAGGITVLYTVTSGAATLGCGLATCPVTTTGDGRASMMVTATNSSISIVTASLTNGESLQAHFYGGPAAVLTSITPMLYAAAGGSISWPVQALVLSGGTASSGQSVTWNSASGIVAPAAASTTNTEGIASATLSVGPLAEAQTATTSACLSGSSQCASFNVFGSRPEYASLAAVSGTQQSISLTYAALPVTMRLLDMNGNAMAGGTVTVHQALYSWTSPCPPHGRCAQPQLLATKITTVNSAIDGSVTITPLTIAGQATTLLGIATTGNTGSLTFSVDQHP